jgi:hypothetical protein
LDLSWTLDMWDSTWNNIRTLGGVEIVNTWDIRLFEKC